MTTYDPINKIWSGPSNPPIYNPNVGLGYLILNLLKTTPDRVIQVNADDGTKTTCSEMFAKSVKIARFLSSIGLKQHDIVGIIARNSENLTPIVFACLTLGLPINPLSPLMNEKDIIYMYEKTKPKVIFCDYDFLPIVLSAVDKIPLENCKIVTIMKRVEAYQFVDEIIEETDKKVDDFEIPLIDSTSTISFIMCTSGTTSMMKAACKSHSQLIANIADVRKSSFEHSDVIFFASTLYAITTVYAILLSALFGGKRVVSTADVTPENFMDVVDQSKASTIFFPPVLLTAFNRSNIQRSSDYVKTVIAGAMIITPDFMEKVKILFPNARIVNAYASSEGDIITYKRKDSLSWNSGQVTSGYQVKITNEEGNNLGPNELGEICYKPRVAFMGYYEDTETYKETVKNGWIVSGDLGYFDDEGFLFVGERIKHMLKNILTFTPQEIETIINEIDGVIASSVIGVYDDGIDVTYAFVIKDPAKNLDQNVIKNHVSERVIEQKRITGDVLFVDSFPLTLTGKIKRRELKEMAKKIHENNKNI